MGSLNLIQQMLLREHPALESNILSSSEALHVWRNKSDIKGLRYLPNFHLIFQAHNDENLTVKLMTFHGKTVDSRAFKQHNEDLPEHVKDFIQHYSTGLILCQVCKLMILVCSEFKNLLNHRQETELFNSFSSYSYPRF